MIAATSSKYVSERSIRNSWSCDACGFGFGTAASALRSGEQVKSSGNADGEAADYCQTFISSSHCKEVFIACLRAHFDVVLRKLIAELQAFSQSIQETPMVRFYSSIYADDKMFIRQMSCDSAFHGSPYQIAAAHRTKIEMLGKRSRSRAAYPYSCRKLALFVQRHDI